MNQRRYNKKLLSPAHDFSNEFVHDAYHGLYFLFFILFTVCNPSSKSKTIRIMGYEDLIILINTNSSVGKVAFGLVLNKMSGVPNENSKVAWNR